MDFKKLIKIRSLSSCGQILHHRFIVPTDMTVNGVYMLGNIKGDVRECLGAISKHNPTSTMKIWYMITMEMLVADNGKKIRHFIDFSSDHMTLKKPLLEF